MVSVRFGLLASFAVVALTAVAVRGQDPFSLEFKSPRPLPLTPRAVEPKLPDVLPPITPAPPAAKNDVPPMPTKMLSPVDKLASLIELTASVEPKKVRRGETVWVTVTGLSKSYSYTYSAVKDQRGSTTRIKYVNADGLDPLVPIDESAPEKFVDELGDEHWIMRDRFFWKQELLVKPDAKPGVRKFDVQVLLQICTKGGIVPGIPSQCLIAGSAYRPLPVELEIDDAPPVTPSKETTARRDPTVPADDVVTKIDVNDLPGLLLAAFGGAIFMLLTPCVFPMIPITVNYFVKQSEKEHHRPFFMASIYAGSIVLLLTLAMLLVGGIVGALANDAWFNLGMGAVLILFALGLFGLFDVDLTIFGGAVLFVLTGYLVSRLIRIGVPPTALGDFPLAVISLALTVPVAFVLNRLVHLIAHGLGFEGWSLLGFLHRQESRGGVIGAAFMATTFTITGFSCMGPFLALVIAQIAKPNTPLVNLILAALTYSVTFAAPFFLLALFPAWLKKLPKGGGWMTTIKVTMGFLEIAFALKFLAVTDIAWFPGDPRIFNFDTILCAYIALAVACALHLFGMFRLDHDDPISDIGPIRMVFATMFLGLAAYLAPLLFGIQPKGVIMDGIVSFLPVNFDTTRGQGGGRGAGEGIWLQDDYKAAWALARKENKRILIDFTGVNCANCRINERNVFTDPEVANRFKNFVCVKLYTDIAPDPQLRPDQAKARAMLQQGYQTGLGLELAQPTYAIIEPNREQAFDGDRLQAKLIDSRNGVVQKADFLKFLSRDGEDARKTAWIQDDFGAAWRLAKEQKKPIFIEFTGVNSANCRLNERNVLLAPEVVPEFGKYVSVKLFTDVVPDPGLKLDEARVRAQKQLQLQADLGLEFAQPTYALVEPIGSGPFDNGKPQVRVLDSRNGIQQAAGFIRFLRQTESLRGDAGQTAEKPVALADGK
jgi:thiol:disulfide interchange protein